MISLYALFNSINDEIYIGISADVILRLKQHNAGKSRYTKAYKPWQVFYCEEHGDYAKARKREIYFKTTGGRRELRRKLAEFDLSDSKK